MVEMIDEESSGSDVCEHVEGMRDGSFTFGRMGRSLPHLLKERGTFFVTFCLQDAVPAKLANRAKRDGDGQPDRIAERSEPIANRGSLVLKLPEIGEIVDRSITHFQGDRYGLHAWVVMPNHVHAVLTPYQGHDLSSILHSWKSYTALKINKTLGREGQLWQRESFDHVVRNMESLVSFVEYSEQNPVVAGLCRCAEDWPLSSARFRRGS